MEQTLTIKTLYAGQSRPYADRVYEAELIFSRRELPWTPDKEFVKRCASLMVREFVDSQERNILDAYLALISEIGKGRWYVKIIQPYSD